MFIGIFKKIPKPKVLGTPLDKLTSTVVLEQRLFSSQASTVVLEQRLFSSYVFLSSLSSQSEK